MTKMTPINPLSFKGVIDSKDGKKRANTNPNQDNLFLKLLLERTQKEYPTMKVNLGDTLKDAYEANFADGNKLTITPTDLLILRKDGSKRGLNQKDVLKGNEIDLQGKLTNIFNLVVKKFHNVPED